MSFLTEVERYYGSVAEHQRSLDEICQKEFEQLCLMQRYFDICDKIYIGMREKYPTMHDYDCHHKCYSCNNCIQICTSFDDDLGQFICLNSACYQGPVDLRLDAIDTSAEADLQESVGKMYRVKSNCTCAQACQSNIGLNDTFSVCYDTDCEWLETVFVPDLSINEVWDDSALPF